MKALLALLVVPIALAACTRYIDRPSTPSVVTTPAVSERVIEKPTAASGATAAHGCIYASQTYSNGALACQNHAEFRCREGTWERTATPSC